VVSGIAHCGVEKQQTPQQTIQCQLKLAFDHQIVHYLEGLVKHAFPMCAHNGHRFNQL
jgi:hypothetical protein